MNRGFIKLRRTDETLELLNDPNAFILLTVIALRARRTDEFNLHDLRSGEALVGDHARYGLSEQQYRSARKRLARWGFATFKPTTRGTVAMLLDDRVYDINEARDQRTGNELTTDGPRTASGRATTNKNEKKEKKEKKYPADSDERRLSELLLNLLLERKPDFHRPDIERWAGEIDRMIHRDGRLPERIEAVIRWCQADPFWSNNILSTAKLRKHFDRLELEMSRNASAPARESTLAMVERMEREGTL
jgi:hypothetical protein